MYNVGVIQLLEHPALDRTREGIFDTLRENNLVASKNLLWIYECAQGNQALASQIIRNFISKEVDVIVCLGTTPTQIAAKMTKELSGKRPAVMFASVTDPVDAKLIINTSRPEGNITGVSNFVPVESQFKEFKKILPALKTLGVIYNPGDMNSAKLLQLIHEKAKDFGILIKAVSAYKTSDVPTATQSLIGKVDAIFINNDNTALAAFDAITKIANQNKTPVLVSDCDCIDKGALVALGADQYALGKQTGNMIVRYLKQKISISDIPVEWATKIDLVFNDSIANELGIIR
ncbi:MAG: ABC transporter substrate-binding protein [Alphaproteobacteria bacterium]